MRSLPFLPRCLINNNSSGERGSWSECGVERLFPRQCVNNATCAAAAACVCVCVCSTFRSPPGGHVGRPWQNYDFTYKKTLKFNIKWHVIWAGRAQDTRQRDSDSDLTNGKPHVTCHMPHTTCHMPHATWCACVRLHVCVCLSHRHHQICLNCIHRATFNFDWKLLRAAGGKASLGTVRVEGGRVRGRRRG